MGKGKQREGQDDRINLILLEAEDLNLNRALVTNFERNMPQVRIPTRLSTSQHWKKIKVCTVTTLLKSVYTTIVVPKGSSMGTSPGYTLQKHSFYVFSSEVGAKK